MKKIFKYLSGKYKTNKSYFIITLAFLAIPALLISFITLRKTSKDPETLYVKVRLSQGLWWVNSQRPSLWLAQNIKPGDVEKNLFGDTISEIEEVRYYPHTEENQTDVTYDVYLTLKLNVSYNTKTQKYVYKRSTVAVGAPIEFDFSKSQISGTVVDLSKNQFVENYVTKHLVLVNERGQTDDNPYLFNSIKVGDTYFDGIDTVFKVTGKRLKTSYVVIPSAQGRVQNIIVDVEMKVKERNGLYVWGEEKVINSGSFLGVSTQSFNFKDFVVSEIH